MALRSTQDHMGQQERCSHTANLVIAHFLEAVRNFYRTGNADPNKVKVLRDAARSVRDHPARIWSGDMLEECRGIGAQFRAMIENNLWQLAPPEPPTVAEVAEEASRQLSLKAAAKAHNKRKAEAAKAAAAKDEVARLAQHATMREERAEAIAERLADASVTHMWQGGPEPMDFEALNSDLVMPLHVARSAAAAGKRHKIAACAKEKGYLPGRGTANYAFLVCLLEAKRVGQESLTKDELIDRADASGLTNRPVRGNAARAQSGLQFHYDGWSSFKQLTAADPPLVTKRGRPMKISLTPEGAALAERLAVDAEQQRGSAGAGGPDRVLASQGSGSLARRGSEHSGLASRGAWRLPGVGGEWGVEERDIRVPPLPPGARFADVYEVVLVLDHREQFGRRGGGAGRLEMHAEAAAQLRNLGVTVDTRQAEAGDAMWIARARLGAPRAEYVLDAIVERKSVADLLASVKGGRYEKQKYSLRRCGLRRLMYLIEGVPEAETAGVDLKIVRTAGYATEVIDGFQVLRTESAGATFRLYARITQCLQAKYGPLTADHPAVERAGAAEPLPTWAQFSARVAAAKKLTVRDVWGLMLTSLPGVGSELAEAVLRAYPTPLSLWRAYAAAQSAASAAGQPAGPAAAAVLAGLPVSAHRKVSPAQAAKVFGGLFACGWQAAAAR
ncbi:hypothetical protein WJX81_007468 [Elliptochloris bilobata]|uniref:Crossover junction endonuclease MUS81 n=1 Tax=Elliptochloris bilobata TaxID=381761 RepID=A0AAW1RCL9_9CHLO